MLSHSRDSNVERNQNSMPARGHFTLPYDRVLSRRIFGTLASPYMRANNAHGQGHWLRLISKSGLVVKMGLRASLLPMCSDTYTSFCVWVRAIPIERTQRWITGVYS